MDHQHTLQLNGSAVSSFTCSGCKELGFETSYICQNTNCNYILHKECAQPAKHAVHPFFKNCNFEFCEKAREGEFCDICGKDLLGFVYAKQKKKGFFKRVFCIRYVIHPCCLNLKENILNDDGKVIMTLSHEVKSDCVVCNKRDVDRKHFKGWPSLNGWSYVFDLDSDGKSSCIHVSCINDMVAKSLINKLGNTSSVFVPEKDNNNQETTTTAAITTAAISVPEKYNNNQETTTTTTAITTAATTISKGRRRSFMKFSKKAGRLTMLGVRLTMLFSGDVTSIGGIVADVASLFSG